MPFVRRFFLRLPKWDTIYNEGGVDLFNVKNLDFPHNYGGEEYPDFLSGDIAGYIEILKFTKDSDAPYKPGSTLSTKLDNYCVGYESGYLIPLYLMVNPKKDWAISERFRDILKRIAEDIKLSIRAHFCQLKTRDLQCAFIDEIIEDEREREEIKKSDDDAGLLIAFDEKLDYKQELWREKLKEYLDSCLKYLSLNQIRVNSSQRARAIDIYENLNRGGVSLNTFDLIMARVAKKNPVSLSERIKNAIQKEADYDAALLPDGISNTFIKETSKKDDQKDEEYIPYKASVRMNCYNESKNEINSKYLDAFLDVLCLCCNNPSGDPDKYELRFIKKNEILNLTPDQIDNNCEKVVDALDRALFFFQGRCGLRNISEFNYNLALVLVATIFIDDNNYRNKKVHELLEAWYWTALFAGELDQDQNQIIIKHLKMLTAMINGTEDKSWLENRNNSYVFKKTNYSDKNLLLMEKVKDGRTPKRILRQFICQYLLAGTYMDMFDETLRVSVFSPVANTLEAHHIIPLGSVKKYGESTAELRKNDEFLCNSPLNFALITKKANDEISSDSLDVYIKKISKAAASVLHIPNLEGIDLNNENGVRGLLSARFDFLQGDVHNHITVLLDSWN